MFEYGLVVDNIVYSWSLIEKRTAVLGGYEDKGNVVVFYSQDPHPK